MTAAIGLKSPPHLLPPLPPLQPAPHPQSRMGGLPLPRRKKWLAVVAHAPDSLSFLSVCSFFSSSSDFLSLSVSALDHLPQSAHRESAPLLYHHRNNTIVCLIASHLCSPQLYHNVLFITWINWAACQMAVVPEAVGSSGHSRSSNYYSTN